MTPADRPGSMTADELATRVAPWRRAQAQADALVADRDAAIKAAVAARLTHREIAEATGLTPGRTAQIAPRDRKVCVE